MEAPPVGPPAAATSGEAAADCGGAPLIIHFFDVGQALSVLVELPDGRKLLVDAGESPTRPGCGAPCKEWHQRLLSGLSSALGAARLDGLWITHQHSDHLGGVPPVLQQFGVAAYFDNGTELEKVGIAKARAAAVARNARIIVEDPTGPIEPLPPSSALKLTPVLPAAWPVTCDSTHANNCSIGLRIDYCASSILFTGDAEELLEADLNPGDIDLLQVGHHGSDTSSSAPFLERVRPEYGVISSGKPGEGTNRTYCHPRASTVEKLSAMTGGAGSRRIKAFDASVSCQKATAANWVDVPASDHLWATAADGNVVLATAGDGKFERQ